MNWLKRLPFSLALVAATIATLLIAAPQITKASVYEGTIDISCSGIVATGSGAHILDRDNTGTGEERIRVLAEDGAGNVILDYTYQTALGTYGGGIGDWTWDTAPMYNPITVQIISVAGNGLPMQVDYTETGTCEGLPTYVMETTPEPGCVDTLPISEESVVGEVKAPAQLFAQPGVAVAPQTVLEPGKTAWVLGVNSGGDYYKILWECSELWVLRGSMGPNFDEVWNGAPLPTTVVE